MKLMLASYEFVCLVKTPITVGFDLYSCVDHIPQLLDCGISWVNMTSSSFAATGNWGESLQTCSRSLKRFLVDFKMAGMASIMFSFISTFSYNRMVQDWSISALGYTWRQFHSSTDMRRMLKIQMQVGKYNITWL